jgi:membrane protein DedA with SNARE-associated domain/rhodanese-related sulfurtransferase
MEYLHSLFVQHGLVAVFVGVFVEQMGVPIPALPFLFLAGVSGANDGVFAVQSLLVATLAATMADSIWFFAGRRFGRRVLGLLCRLSLSPDSCVRQSELSFARRGVSTLVVAKFVPGLSMLAPPLAGALGMTARIFSIFNLAGTVLWAGSGIASGVVFHDQIEYLLQALDDLGNIAWVLMGSLLLAYIAVRAWRRWRLAQLSFNLPRIQADELVELLEKKEDMVLVDVRGPALKSFQDESIPGARHIDLNALADTSFVDWPQGAHTRIVTYCACPNDASAVKAALVLKKKGFKVRVLQGGLDAWSRAGFPLELNYTGA